ncbi:PLD nuclease N-terminal domain-containing protein [Georgenia yuyongxinii]|uniref:PLDc_N domain-containing protein n=1 Tax=Georgenia yuyongxinii TaxID=2589797 RepID=A0A552WNT5_9MICO|nr:PLD nuclease N-terminal domain-containing protein [Georgenia yuyongxinii]TRW44448.1 PLDc_N domain-containing protein [Georgenia yuyongxinii]TRW44767.1 PLDc_N domain-containing protein [Georgenia yuyongxinii]
MGRLFPVILLVAVIVYALIDCVRTPGDRMPAGIPKFLWLVLIVVFPGLGALAWIVISRIALAEASRQAGTRPQPGLWSAEPTRRTPWRSGPVAPDDDPEFLARLEAEQRRAERDRRARRRAEGPAEGTKNDDAPGESPGGGAEGSSSDDGDVTPGTPRHP